MLPFFSEKYGNAQSFHQKGKEAMIALDKARDTVAKILNCRASEIVFTGSATEANNLAILGTARANKEKGRHLITSKIEHSSVREPFQELENEGFEVTYLDVDRHGMIDLENLEKSIRQDTILVSIMYANNEIGTIEQITEIGEICRKREVCFHTDAAQAAVSETLNVETLKPNLMTLNGSKIYGPKGVGALYIRRDTAIKPITYGGSHEHGLRPGTHNVPNIVGFAKALELIQTEKADSNIRLTKLRDRLIGSLLKKVPGSYLNGHPAKRLPNNINITIPDINAQELMLQLDEIGIYVSTGSTCGAGIKKPSAVLLAIGLPTQHIHSSLRLSLGKNTSQADIDCVIEKLPPLVEKLLKNSGFQNASRSQKSLRHKKHGAEISPRQSQKQPL